MSTDTAISSETGRGTAADLGLLLLRIFFGAPLFTQGSRELSAWFGGARWGAAAVAPGGITGAPVMLIRPVL